MLVYYRPIERRTERAALTEAIEVRAWTCATCPTMTDPGERYCRSCKMYWDDVTNDLFIPQHH